MPQIKVTGKFNIDACDDCPLVEECPAYAYADGLRNELGKDAERIKARYSAAVEQVALHINDTGRKQALDELDIANRRLKGLVRRSEQLQEVITRVIVMTVEAQIIPDGQAKLESVETGLIKLQQTRALGPVAPAVTELDRIGTDIRLYTSTGICGAIDVEEIETSS